MEIDIIDMPAVNVLGMRKEGSYTIIQQMIRDLKRYALEAGVNENGHPVFLSHETSKQQAIEADRAGKADVEVCLPIDGFVKGDNLVRYYQLPGGTMARVVHQGAYENAEKTYDELFEWLKRNKKFIAGPIREVYVNDPMDVLKEELITQIYVPIE